MTTSLIAEEDRSFYIKKIWCHGQSVIPPMIGVAALTHAHREPDCASVVWMGFVAPFILCVWPFVSWKAIADATSAVETATLPSSLLPVSQSGVSVRVERGKRSRKVILWGGWLVLAVYLYIIISTVRNCGGDGDEGTMKGLKLLLLIFSVLAGIETIAFLAIMATCLPKNSHQYEEQNIHRHEG